MTATGIAAPAAPISLFDRERTIAQAGFNRWLVPPAALAIHLCIGMAYGFSVFWAPLGRAIGTAAGTGKAIACAGDATSFFGKVGITGNALFATNCDWTQFDLGWMFTLFFVILGCSAAIWGGWLERNGPRKAGVVAAVCWCGGLLISAYGIYVHQLWMLWLGSGVLGGIGLGLGYISPVSTLIKWFPDRRGMATGMAIMGFGGGALIGSPLADMLMNHFKTSSTVGVWQTFVVLAGIYFVFMMAGAFSYRVPPAGWQPEGYVAPQSKNAMITQGHVDLKNAHKTPQFWLIWAVLCLNVSAGIGIIGAASTMLQETFGGKLFGDASIDYGQFTSENKVKAAAVGAGFVALFSLFNIGGRFFWASLSDKIGRKQTYFAFFTIGIVCYGLASTLAGWGSLGLFAAAFCVIASMYGGGFATVPAYLADMFGTQYVGAIHGRLLTAWSTAGIIGPVIVNYLHDSRIAQKIPYAQVYDQIFYVLAALLVLGLLANALIRPVADKWFMKEADVAALQARASSVASATTKGSFGIGRGGLDGTALMAWSCVGIPIACGIWMTLSKALMLFK